MWKRSLPFVVIYCSCVVILTECFEYYEDFPCNGTLKILETFNTSHPEYYTIVIIPDQFSAFSKRVDLRLQFDSFANVTLDFKWLSLYDDSLSLQILTWNEDSENMTMKVQPSQGKPFPNLISAKINMDEICEQGVHKGVWDQYRTTETTSSPTINSPSELTTPQNQTPREDCGMRRILHEGHVISGSGARPGDWPWHVAIYLMKTKTATLKYTCGGSLVSKTRVVTAGHCVVENGAVVIPDRTFVSLGKHNYVGGDIGLQERSVYEISLHPDFVWHNLSHDISILKLATEVVYTDYVQPICLWEKTNLPRMNLVGEHGYVVGWGSTLNTKFSGELQQAVMPVQSDLKCIRKDPLFYSKFLTKFTLCAGFANGTGACNGDSGGGFFFPLDDGQGQDVWHMRGIISLGVSQRDRSTCNPRFYTIFTDIAQFLDFIQQHL